MTALRESVQRHSENMRIKVHSELRLVFRDKI